MVPIIRLCADKFVGLIRFPKQMHVNLMANRDNIDEGSEEPPCSMAAIRQANDKKLAKIHLLPIAANSIDNKRKELPNR